MKHPEIELTNGKSIYPIKAYRLKGGYRLLVEENLNIWHEFNMCYSLYATKKDWDESAWAGKKINRENVTKIANFYGED